MFGMFYWDRDIFRTYFSSNFTDAPLNSQQNRKSSFNVRNQQFRFSWTQCTTLFSKFGIEETGLESFEKVRIFRRVYFDEFFLQFSNLAPSIEINFENWKAAIKTLMFMDFMVISGLKHATHHWSTSNPNEKLWQNNFWLRMHEHQQGITNVFLL